MATKTLQKNCNPNKTSINYFWHPILPHHIKEVSTYGKISKTTKIAYLSYIYFEIKQENRALLAVFLYC